MAPFANTEFSSLDGTEAVQAAAVMTAAEEMLRRVEDVAAAAEKKATEAEREAEVAHQLPYQVATELALSPMKPFAKGAPDSYAGPPQIKRSSMAPQGNTQQVIDQLGPDQYGAAPQPGEVFGGPLGGQLSGTLQGGSPQQGGLQQQPPPWATAGAMGPLEA